MGEHTVAANSTTPLRLLRSWAGTGFSWAIGLAFFLPIAWMALTSLKPEVLAVTNPPTFIFTPTFENYLSILGAPDAMLAFRNSLVASLGSTVLALTFAFPIAFAMAVRRVKRASDALFFVISTRMLPLPGVIIPIYMAVQALGQLDNIGTLVAFYTTMNMPLAVWMLRAYLLDMPKEIVEAATVDGANGWQLVSRVVLPLIRPSLAATAVLCMVFAWSEFFLAVSLTSYDAATIPVYLTGFVTDRGLYWGSLSAMAVLASLPVVLLGTFAQRYIMKGFSMDSDK
ncbi:carbohydrate ABC transporter permease [Pseudactinotalea sp.]|uniref:carbohydrate ABC transporter permease n=1 Tax=Pseudactinotalea sp. TaxID=1926260 RepID=UPI003B3A8F37